ncbi:MAG: hypothetical protein K1X82_10975 [Bacteroidia bacterium]|nr:hypothetical protein [Bacteroidia bacterium]
MIEQDLENNWNEVRSYFESKFGGEMDLDGIIFLIGVNELGQGFRKFKKHEKMDIMHVAICKLLSRYGFYELEGYDEEGWPHYKLSEELPVLKPGQQQFLVKQAIIEYYQDFIKE